MNWADEREHHGDWTGMSLGLEGKTAVVVGGGSGIGLGIATALADAGCRVALGGRRASLLEEICGRDSRLIAHPIDVADRDSVGTFFKWARQELAQIPIFVNSAGINIRTRTMGDMTPAQWDQVMQVNATGAYNCMYEVLPEMRQRRDGLIINISSIAGKRALTLGGVAYCASKFAMTALGTCVGNEEADRGIRITNLYPGEVNTPILENRPEPVSDQRKAEMLQPEDVGRMVVAICMLPPRAHVAEMVIKPTVQTYV